MKYAYLLISLFITQFSLAQEAEWESIANMPIGKHHPVTFAIDGKGYAFTGSSNSAANSSDGVVYDPQTDSWDFLGFFPGASRSYAIGQAYNGKGYMAFGASDTAYIDEIWEYDPTTDDWNLLASCPCFGRRHPAFVIHDSTMYAGLGDNQFGNLNDWWKYDMRTDQWTQMPNLPGAVRHHPFQFQAGGQVYAGMGHGGPFIYRDWYRFNVETETWQQMGGFPGEARVAGTQFFTSEHGYVLSGDGDNHSFMPTGEFWEYDHVEDEWTELEPHPGISRWAPGSFVINDTVYFLGGQNRQTNVIVNTAYRYSLLPPPDTTDTIAPEGIDFVESIQNETFFYPNPSKDYLYLRAELEIMETKILDGMGRLVYTQQNPLQPIDLTNFTPGYYMVLSELADGSVVTGRLMKQ